MNDNESSCDNYRVMRSEEEHTVTSVTRTKWRVYNLFPFFFHCHIYVILRFVFPCCKPLTRELLVASVHASHSKHKG